MGDAKPVCYNRIHCLSRNREGDGGVGEGYNYRLQVMGNTRIFFPHGLVADAVTDASVSMLALPNILILYVFFFF